MLSATKNRKLPKSLKKSTDRTVGFCAAQQEKSSRSWTIQRFRFKILNLATQRPNYQGFMNSWFRSQLWTANKCTLLFSEAMQYDGQKFGYAKHCMKLWKNETCQTCQVKVVYKHALVYKRTTWCPEKIFLYNDKNFVPLLALPEQCVNFVYTLTISFTIRQLWLHGRFDMQKACQRLNRKKTAISMQLSMQLSGKITWVSVMFST